MIKPQELRIGNKVLRNGIIVSVDNQTFWDVEKYPDQYKPIELTEDWLIKFGFSNEINDWRKIDKSGVNVLGLSQHREYGSSKHLSFYFNVGGSYMLSSIYLEVKYVHQLQNLTFTLTGEELTIKE